MCSDVELAMGTGSQVELISSWKQEQQGFSWVSEAVYRFCRVLGTQYLSVLRVLLCLGTEFFTCVTDQAAKDLSSFPRST